MTQKLYTLILFFVQNPKVKSPNNRNCSSYLSLVQIVLLQCYWCNSVHLSRQCISILIKLLLMIGWYYIHPLEEWVSLNKNNRFKMRGIEFQMKRTEARLTSTIELILPTDFESTWMISSGEPWVVKIFVYFWTWN